MKSGKEILEEKIDELEQVKNLAISLFDEKNYSTTILGDIDEGN
jgi:predicted HTH domain antitoxin